MAVCVPLVCDLGSSELRLGRANAAHSPYQCTNALVRNRKDNKVYVGEELDQGRAGDPSQLNFMRPHDRGWLTQWEWQLSILKRAYHSLDSNGIFDIRRIAKGKRNIVNTPVATPCLNPEDSELLIIQPIGTPVVLLESQCEALFEEFGVAAVATASSSPLIYRMIQSSLSLEKTNSEAKSQSASMHKATIVVDSGYSATWIVPLLNGSPLKSACRRLDVGGKALTNVLKEWISFRTWDMSSETYLVNSMKEKLCYVSIDFKQEMNNYSKNSNLWDRQYLLPEGSSSLGTALERGASVPPGSQALKLGRERFSVPEVLFRPSDVGIPQMGLIEGIQEAIRACPIELRNEFSKNLILSGGNILFPCFVDRFIQDWKSCCPSDLDLHIFSSLEYSKLLPWMGGCMFMNTVDCKSIRWTKQEYLEQGKQRLFYQRYITL